MENKKKLFDIRYKVKIYNVHVEPPRWKAGEGETCSILKRWWLRISRSTDEYQPQIQEVLKCQGLKRNKKYSSNHIIVIPLKTKS